MILIDTKEMAKISKALSVYNIKVSSFGIDSITELLVDNDIIKLESDDHITVDFNITRDTIDNFTICNILIRLYTKCDNDILITSISGHGTIDSINKMHLGILQNSTYRYCQQVYETHWYLFVDNYRRLPERMYYVRKLNNKNK